MTLSLCALAFAFFFLEEKLFIMASVPLNVRRLNEWMSVCWVMGGETGNLCLYYIYIYTHINMSISNDYLKKVKKNREEKNVWVFLVLCVFDLSFTIFSKWVQ